MLFVRLCCWFILVFASSFSPSDVWLCSLWPLINDKCTASKPGCKFTPLWCICLFVFHPEITHGSIAPDLFSRENKRICNVYTFSAISLNPLPTFWYSTDPSLPHPKILITIQTPPSSAANNSTLCMDEKHHNYLRWRPINGAMILQASSSPTLYDIRRYLCDPLMSSVSRYESLASSHSYSTRMVFVFPISGSKAPMYTISVCLLL